METVLSWVASGLMLLLAIAIVVAWWEQLRASARTLRMRQLTRAQQAFDWDLAHQDRASRKPAAEPVTLPPASAEDRAVLVSALRRVARPAVGQPNSGWSETEPMVLGGPGTAHFDPTEKTRH